MENRNALPFVAVIGPTGAGKSACAVAFARAVAQAVPDITPHILNADVSQMYPGLPIATNKPRGAEDTEGIPHHLISCLQPTEPYSVRRFVVDCLAVVERVCREEANPLFVVCGGTHYYVQGLLFEDGDADGDEDASECGQEAAEAAARSVVRDGESPHDALRRLDPASADRWHPNDTQRVFRCLAHVARTGNPAPPAAESTPRLRRDVAARGPPLVLEVTASRDVLEVRHRERVEAMVRRGLLQEVAQFFADAPPSTQADGRFLARAIGYHEFLPLLNAPDAGAAALRLMQEGGRDAAIDRAVDDVVVHTRRYALQQEQWVRNRICGRYGSLLHPLLLRIAAGRTAQAAARDLAASWVADRALRELPMGVERVAAASETGADDASEPKKPRDLAVRECDACRMSLCGLAQWEAHVQSRKHRGAVKRLEERKRRPVSRGGLIPDDEFERQQRREQPPADAATK